MRARDISVQRRRVATAAAACVTLAICGVFTASAVGRSQPGQTAKTVSPTIPVGLHLKQSAQGVETKVLSPLGPDAHINSVLVVPSRAELWSALANVGSPPEAEVNQGGPAWIVHAYGVFQPVNEQPGSSPQGAPRNGWVVVDDASGVTLAYGWGSSLR